MKAPPRAKPEPSYASNRLTKDNYKGGHLLSTFRNEDDHKNENGKSNNADEKLPESEITGPPISSCDEEDDDGSDVSSLSDELVIKKRNRDRDRDNRPTGKTLEEKPAGNGNDADGTTEKDKKKEEKDSGTPRRTSGRRKKPEQKSSNSNSPKQKVPQKRRTSVGTFANFSDSDDGLAIFSSQSTKRAKQAVYGQNSIKSKSSFNKAPRSSAPSSATPSGSKQDGKADGQEEEEDGGFKVPMDVDLASPPPKPGIKQPPNWPNDSTSSSSMATSSARDAQLFDIDDDSPLSSPLSSVPSFSLELTHEEKMYLAEQEAREKSNESLCPMCKEKVDLDLLREFQSQPKQRIRDQQRFCDSHKKQSAEVEWKEKGYPTIDWDTFDDRISRHFAELEKILVPGSPSYYRNILDTAMKSGKARNFRLSLSGDGLETISCGYYGSRGAGKMY